MSVTAIGYLVAGDHGVFTLCPEKRGDLLLYVIGRATVFPTRVEARNAIRRTRAWSDRQGLNWREQRHRVVALHPRPQSRPRARARAQRA